MTELEREELFIRNNKIIEIVVDAIQKYCPLEVDLIGIGGSFCTGDFYEKSDLDLVIIGSDEAAKVLNRCFILNNVGFDVYVQNWSRFVSMAEYNNPYVTKLIDLDIKYVKNDGVKDRYTILANKLKENMSDTDSIKAKIGMKYELCRAYYKKMIDSKDKSDILMNYGMFIRTVEFIIYMINKEYVKGSTRNIPDEINKLSIMPSNFLKAYNSIFDFDNMIEQVKQSEEWLEERLLVDNELELKLKEMFSDSSYVDWLLNFTLKYSKFKDTEWMYYPGNISSEDYKRVNDMDLFYYGIKKYAAENHRYPITTGSGIFYRIKYNEVGFTIGIVGGLNVEYICSREELDPEKNYIDLSYIINNKKCDDVEFIDAQMKSLSNLIITLHQSGVPIESIEATIVNVINDIKPKNDGAIVKSLRV